MSGPLSGMAFGLPVGLAISAIHSASLPVWLTAVVCFSVALATTRLIHEMRRAA